jgi:hypothetical protein
MEGTKYNYTFQGRLSGCDDGTTLIFNLKAAVNPNPNLIDCKTLITVPWKVTAAGMEFCNLVQSVTNPDTMDSVGIKAIHQDSTVTIQDSSNTIFVVWLSKGSYRWFRNIQNIGCVLSGDGLYNNCTGTAPLILTIAKVQGNSEGTEIIIIEKLIASGFI